MSDSKLLYLSENKLSELEAKVEDNIDRYRNAGFSEFANAHGWAIPAEIEIDLSHLNQLKPTTGAENEVQNSLCVWRALHNLTPALATENRVWTRLSHIEAFEFSQVRWLKTDKDDAALAKQVRDHFFAPSLTRYRDDHSIGRLWWNAYVSKLLWPEDQEAALKLILLKADIRSNLVERALTFSRLEVGQALLRMMSRTPEVYATEMTFREFMKSVNKFGSGVLFEAWEREDCDEFMDNCWAQTPTV